MENIIDLTLEITAEMIREAQQNPKIEQAGHLGTHFDGMDQPFPLEYTCRRGVVFDASGVQGRDIDICDIDPGRIEADIFVAFHTGFADSEPYGTTRYHKEHPQLSHALIDLLLAKGVSIIGTDCGGIRRGSEHVPTDQRCADRGVFVVENLRNLQQLLGAEQVYIHTYPIRCRCLSGLPCRVCADARLQR